MRDASRERLAQMVAISLPDRKHDTRAQPARSSPNADLPLRMVVDARILNGHDDFLGFRASAPLPKFVIPCGKL